MSRQSRPTRRHEANRPLFGSVRAVVSHPLADYGFILGATIALLVIGLIMVTSASSVFSLKESGSSYSLASRQLLFAAIGLVLMIVLSRLPVSFFRRMAYPALLASLALLVIVLLPNVGKTVNGQQNWISLGGPFRLQPSEIAKLALIIWIADVLARRHRRVDGWRTLLLPLLPVCGLFVLLILMEGDLGTCLVVLPIIAMLLLVAGAPMKFFGWLGAGVLALIAAMSITTPYRFERFRTWLDPAHDPTGAGWQVMHGQYALATGGWWGVGLGASREKWGFLPEAHTDFILAVLGEELGLAGTLSVLALFVLLSLAAARVALRAEDLFVCFAATGVAVWICAQALINTGAVLGALPITGLPLPLISYGGSSLTLTLMAIGMLLAFARQERPAAEYLGERRERRRAGRDAARARVRAGTSSGHARSTKRDRPGSRAAGRRGNADLRDGRSPVAAGTGASQGRRRGRSRSQ